MTTTTRTSMPVQPLRIPVPLWQQAKRAAGTQSETEGRTVSVAEWIREAMRQRLERDG